MATPQGILRHQCSALCKAVAPPSSVTVTSDVESLGDALLLLVQHLLLGFLEVGVRDAHAALPQRQQPRLSADRFDVGAAELVLGHDELLDVDVLGQAHLARVDLEDAALGLDVRQRELDLAVDAPGADEGRVQRLDAVGRHDDLDVAHGIETIQLIEQLEHRPLNLLLAARVGVVALGANGVNLVDEDDGRAHLVSDAEELPHQLGPVSEVLLDQLRSHDTQEGRAGRVGHRFGQLQRLARPGLPV